LLRTADAAAAAVVEAWLLLGLDEGSANLLGSPSLMAPPSGLHAVKAQDGDGLKK